MTGRVRLVAFLLVAGLTSCGPPPPPRGEPAPSAPDPALSARRAAAGRVLLELGLPDAAREALESIPSDQRGAEAALDLARALSQPGDDARAAEVALDAATRFPTEAKEALLEALACLERAWDLKGAVAVLERLRTEFRLTSTERERVDQVRTRLQALAGKAIAVDQDWKTPDRWPFRIDDPFLVEFDRSRGIAVLRKGPGAEPWLRSEIHATGTALEWSGTIALERLDPGAAVQVRFSPPAGADGRIAPGLRFVLGSLPGTLSDPVARAEVDAPFQALRVEPAFAPATAGRYRVRFRVVRTVGSGTAAAIEAAVLEAERSRRVLSVSAVDPTGSLAEGLHVAFGGTEGCEEGSLFRVAVAGVRATVIGGEWKGARRPAGPEPALDEGVRLLSEAKWAEALATLGRIRHGTPESGRATFFSAYAATRAGQPAKAEGLLKEALGRDSELHRRAYYALRWDRGTAGLLGAAIGREGVTALLVRAAGESAAAGYPEEALGDLDAALLVSPTHALAREARANLLAVLGRAEAALADARELAADAQAAPGIVHLRADLLRLAGRVPEALADLDRLIAAGGRASDHALRALAQLRARNLSKAREDVQQAIRLDPRAALPYTLLALCHLQAGDLGPAEIETARALALDPWDGRAHALRGLLHALRKDSESARASLRVAAGLAPEDPDALALRARAWEIMGDATEVGRVQREVERRVPGGTSWVAPR